MSKVYRYIQAFRIGDAIYLPGTIVKDELKPKDITRLIKSGFVAEKKAAIQDEPEDLDND